MVDRSNSDRLRGFCDGQTNRRTFAIVESLSGLKNTDLKMYLYKTKELIFHFFSSFNLQVRTPSLMTFLLSTEMSEEEISKCELSGFYNL